MELGFALLGLGITLAAFIFGFVWQHVNKANNKVIKELSTETRNLMMQETKETRNLMVQESKETRNLIAEEGRFSRESTSKMSETLGHLIVADGERTREIL